MVYVFFEGVNCVAILAHDHSNGLNWCMDTGTFHQSSTTRARLEPNVESRRIFPDFPRKEIYEVMKCWNFHAFFFSISYVLFIEQEAILVSTMDYRARRKDENKGDTTLPETNSSPLKINGWKMKFSLGWPIFRCYVGFTEGRSPTISKSFLRSIVPCLKDMTTWSAVSMLAVISTGRKKTWVT